MSKYFSTKKLSSTFLLALFCFITSAFGAVSASLEERERNLVDEYCTVRGGAISESDARRDQDGTSSVPEVDNQGLTKLLMLAALGDRGNQERVQALVDGRDGCEGDFDFNERDQLGMTALMWASYLNWPWLVHVLLDAGADHQVSLEKDFSVEVDRYSNGEQWVVNYKGYEGDTAYSITRRMGHRECMKQFHTHDIEE